MRESDRQLTAISEPRELTTVIGREFVVPRVIADAGDQATRRFLEFFAATIRNKNTRMRGTTMPSPDGAMPAARIHLESYRSVCYSL
jgi:hypothetical protein